MKIVSQEAAMAKLAASYKDKYYKEANLNTNLCKELSQLKLAYNDLLLEKNKLAISSSSYNKEQERKNKYNALKIQELKNEIKVLKDSNDRYEEELNDVRGIHITLKSQYVKRKQDLDIQITVNKNLKYELKLEEEQHKTKLSELENRIKNLKNKLKARKFKSLQNESHKAKTNQQKAVLNNNISLQQDNYN